METFIGSMVTIFAVSLVMSLLTKPKTDKKTSSIYKFTVRPSSAVRYIAILGTACMGVLGWIQDGKLLCVRRNCARLRAGPSDRYAPWS